MFDYCEPAPSAYEYILPTAKNNESVQEIAQNQLATMSDHALDRRWRLHRFFGTIAVINLPHAIQRREKITSQLQSIDAKNILFFKAVDGRKELQPAIWQKIVGNRDAIATDCDEGRRLLDRLHQSEAGCFMSHYRVLKSIKESYDKAVFLLKEAENSKNEQAIKHAQKRVRKYKSVLVLEDDIGFGIVSKGKTKVRLKGAGRLLREALSQLPEEWDMLYFIVKPAEPVEEYSTHLRKLKKSWCAAAYAVNYTMYESIIDHLKKIEDRSTFAIEPLDEYLSQIHEAHNVYAVFPSLVFHQTGQSFISDRERKHLLQFQPVLKDSSSS